MIIAGIVLIALGLGIFGWGCVDVYAFETIMFAGMVIALTGVFLIIIKATSDDANEVYISPGRLVVEACRGHNGIKEATGSKNTFLVFCNDGTVRDVNAYGEWRDGKEDRYQTRRYSIRRLQVD